MVTDNGQSSVLLGLLMCSIVLLCQVSISISIYNKEQDLLDLQDPEKTEPLCVKSSHHKPLILWNSPHFIIGIIGIDIIISIIISNSYYSLETDALVVQVLQIMII